jgi:DNA-binding GntR family transcriptional regulator
MVEQTKRYRAIRLLQSPSIMLARDVAAEHRELLNAAIARDPNAADLLRDHLSRTWRFVANLFKGEATNT